MAGIARGILNFVGTGSIEVPVFILLNSFMDGGRIYKKMERQVEDSVAGSPREVAFTIGARWYARPGRAVALAAELFRRRGYRLVRIVAGPGVWFATFEAIDPDR